MSNTAGSSADSALSSEAVMGTESGGASADETERFPRSMAMYRVVRSVRDSGTRMWGAARLTWTSVVLWFSTAQATLLEAASLSESTWYW